MILFDFSGRLHANVHMNKESIIENKNFIAHLMLTQINIYAKKFGASKTNPFVVCLDTKNCWRYDYFNENKIKFEDIKDMTYKGNRKKDDTIPWDTIHEVCDELCEGLRLYSDFHIIKIDKAEADDIIAVVSKTEKTEPVWVISSDKDFIQLLSPTVKIYDPIKNGFKPEQDIERYMKIHVMIGDKSDNIPAIRKRMGEKTAEKELKNLDTLLATDPELRGRYEFNQNLIDFNYIPKNIEDEILKSLKEQTYHFNTMSLMKVFMKLGLAKFSEDIQAFKLKDGDVKTTLNSHFTTITKNQSVGTSLADFF